MADSNDKRFRALIENSADAIALFSADATWEYASPSTERLLGYHPDTLIGRNGFDLVHPDDTESATRLLIECLQKPHQLVVGELRLRRQDGTWLWIEMRGQNLLAEPTVEAIVVNYQDITEKKAAIADRLRLEADLERHIEQLRAANQSKDEFLAMLGHELRNPLSAVRNAVATASLDESRRTRALEIACRQVDQLGRLIDDLLDVARITQGRITLHTERVSLVQVLERAVESTRSLIDSRGLPLVTSLAPEPIGVEADPVRLEQVFVNLLSNAAKYSVTGGRIDLVAEQCGEEAVVRIRDAGIGIAPEMLPRIWDLFTQGDPGLDRAQGGLGIGLTVVRRLVDLHGARIEAHSEGVGKGAEFVVVFRALPPLIEDGRPVVRVEEPRPRRVHILVVEDNPDAAESLTMLLELFGHSVRTVSDGMAALAAVRAKVPDVMLVDIGLPDMDGHEVARRVRSDPELDHIVLVALTGYGREEDKAHAKAAGFAHHLVKPVNPEALSALLANGGPTEPRPPSVQNDGEVVRGAHAIIGR